MEKKTKRILDIFSEIAKIPRCSKNEERICQWLVDWAKQHHFDVKTDNIGNVLIKIPASKGWEHAPITVIQGHVDMVCEKTKDSEHDFRRDPIELVYDGEWLTADQTTLGADNGIAIALSLAIATDESLVHPPLELLFTVDEETGLTGAKGLAPDFIAGKILLNVDSEDEGVFTVGCAGGKDSEIKLDLNYETIPAGFCIHKLSALGMSGGHSGVDIHLQRANANKILSRALDSLREQGDIRVVSITGGNAANAIPRDAEAILALPKEKMESCKVMISDLEKEIQTEYAAVESSLKIALDAGEDLPEVLTRRDTDTVINLLLALPDGVAGMSHDIPHLVETSNNVAMIRTEENTLTIVSSQRSSAMSLLEAHTRKIEAIARLAGARVISANGYPNWPPDMKSPLLATCIKVYTRLFNREPRIEAIHAGLECGVIGAKYEGMDMISFGPTIKNPHSPDEKLHIPSIGRIWDFMTGLLGVQA